MNIILGDLNYCDARHPLTRLMDGASKIEIMSRTRNSQTNGIPQWQSNKMKSLIVERWQEVWEVVEARKKIKMEN